MKKNEIICFGEIPRDVFPTHKVAGGASLPLVSDRGVQVQLFQKIKCSNLTG